MRVLLVTVGSRGDAEPFCSLAASLAAKGASVDLFLQTDLQHLAPACADRDDSITVHALPFTQLDFYKYAFNPTHGSDHPNPRVKFVGAVADIIGELVLPCLEQLLTLTTTTSARPDAIVASTLARQLAMVLSNKLSVPLYLVQLQPLVPTVDFPHFSQTQDCVQAISTATPKLEHLETYIELERFQYDFLQEHVEKTWQAASITTTPPPTFDETLDMLTGTAASEDGDDGDAAVYLVNAFSSLLVPACTTKGNKVLHIGDLSSCYIPADWEPPAAVTEFLRSLDEPPVCIGYGSMPFGKVSVLLEALKQAQRPAILVGSSMVQAVKESIDEWVNENVVCVDNVPYAWLLPRCSMMFSHGGAGAIHATLRAGIPAVVSPFMGDQFFWILLLQTKGLGVQASKTLGELCIDNVVSSIEKADSKCRDACKLFGISMRESEPNGANALTGIIMASNKSSTVAP